MLLDQIADYLEAQGVVGGASGWVVQLSSMEPTPDKVVVLYDTPGDLPDIDDSGAEEYDEPGFQVRVRGDIDGYEAARTKIQEVYDTLHKSEPPSATGETAIVFVYATQSGPLPMGKDSNSRPELVWNFRALKQREEV